jgi:hypothetical protein
MKYLNRGVLCACILMSVTGTLSGETLQQPLVKPLGTTSVIFGKSFDGYSNFGTSNYFERDEAGRKTRLTIIRLSSKEDALSFGEERLFQFRSIFEVKRVDYPGQYSKSIECAAEFKPTFLTRDIPGGKAAYFKGFAGANMVAGVCATDLIKYNYLYGIITCVDSNYLVEIEDFLDLSKTGVDSTMDLVTCYDPSLMDRR